MQSRGVLMIACGLVATALLVSGRAQGGKVPSTATACTADPKLPAFEVASITPVANKENGDTSVGPYGLPRFTMRHVSLGLLLSFSFDLQPANFINVPRGFDDIAFDLQVASTNGAPLTYETLKPRMQQLLEQRFCLKTHTGTKQVSGYALLTAKGGAKMTRWTESADTQRAGQITQHEISGAGVDMTAFAIMLASSVGRPVQDQTELQGRYTLRVKFAAVEDTESTLPSIFTALKEQLGLELKAAQVPVRTLIIDHLNLTPTEN